MRLYSGLSAQFIRDSAHNQIAEKLKTAFFEHFRYQPPSSEVTSWRNSLRAVSQVFEAAGLRDHGILLEYQLPMTSKRLDCLVCGRDGNGSDQAVIIELKQWERADEAIGDKMVTTFVGGAHREVLHPSAQVGQYQMYLEDAHTAFYEEPRPVGLAACSYLHNYFPDSGDILFDSAFDDLVRRFPVFTGDGMGELKDFLTSRLEGGEGSPVLDRIERSRYRPSKKLMEHVAGVIQGRGEYVLLDEQLLVFEKVLDSARRGFDDRRKTVLLIRGGPGTGKSVIAINLMAALLRENKNAHYATGSKAFTETLRHIVGTRGSVQFRYFNSYQDAQPNEIDVLICDESHRLRRESGNRFTLKSKRTGVPQIEEILRASKVSVFFIDDRQLVRPEEIGSADYIIEQATARGCGVSDYQLEAQFRCAGSEAFVGWIDSTLDIARTAHVIWEEDEAFEFAILNSPEELDARIRTRIDEGFSARMTAGYCWKWSTPNVDGTLTDDVQIGGFHRPWNARPEAKRLARGIPKAPLWAVDPGGVDQVGCIYTAQGFEFDYVGVIFGLDLRYDFDHQSWVGDPNHSFDTPVKRSKERFADLVKNTYRVLLSRGLKGCYVHFMDRDTERFVRSRMRVDPTSR
jgi:hypothetical protein